MHFKACERKHNKQIDFYIRLCAENATLSVCQKQDTVGIFT